MECRSPSGDDARAQMRSLLQQSAISGQSCLCKSLRRSIGFSLNFPLCKTPLWTLSMQHTLKVMPLTMRHSTTSCMPHTDP
jgi:hypothetical protein